MMIKLLCYVDLYFTIIDYVNFYEIWPNFQSIQKVQNFWQYSKINIFYYKLCEVFMLSQLWYSIIKSNYLTHLIWMMHNHGFFSNIKEISSIRISISKCSRFAFFFVLNFTYQKIDKIFFLIFNIVFFYYPFSW